MKHTERQRWWLAQLQRARDSGQTLKAYAQSHGISLYSRYDAKSRLTRAGLWRDVTFKPTRASTAFVPVQIEPARPTAWVCRLTHTSGGVVECAQLPDPAWLRALRKRETDDATA